MGADRQRAGRGPARALLAGCGRGPRACWSRCCCGREVPPVDAGLLPIVAAVGAAEALGPEARIVWPNDLLIGGRKVAGILCEMSADQERVDWAVAGIGVNVRSAPGPRRRPLGAPGALADLGEPPRRADLLVELLGALGRRYAEWVREGPGAVLAAFAARDGLRGRSVAVSLAGEEVDRQLRGHRRPWAPAPAHRGGRAPARRGRGGAGGTRPPPGRVDSRGERPGAVPAATSTSPTSSSATRSGRCATGCGASATRRSRRSSTATGSGPSSRSRWCPSWPRSACAAAPSRATAARGSARSAPGLVSMELARGDGSVSTFHGVHSGLAMTAIGLLGSEEQKDRWLPAMARLEAVGAFALTEPDHGSDAVTLETRVRRLGDGYVIDGAKRWIGNATFADLMIVWARDASGRGGRVRRREGRARGRGAPDHREGGQARLLAGRHHPHRRARAGGEPARGGLELRRRRAGAGRRPPGHRLGRARPRRGRLRGRGRLRARARDVRHPDRRPPDHPVPPGEDARGRHGMRLICMRLAELVGRAQLTPAMASLPRCTTPPAPGRWWPRPATCWAATACCWRTTWPATWATSR